MPESRASLGWADLAFAFLAAVTLFIAPAARAQRNTRARPVYQRPIISQPSMRSIAPLPMPLRPALSPVATAVQRPILNPLPRALPSRISPAPQLAMPRSYAPYTFAEPALPPGVFEPNFRPTVAWRGIGAFGSPYHLGGWFAPDYGYWQFPQATRCFRSDSVCGPRVIQRQFPVDSGRSGHARGSETIHRSQPHIRINT